MNLSPTSVLLRRVAARLRLVSLGRWISVGWLSVCVLFAVLFLVSRLSGVIPDWFDFQTLCIVPLAALCCGLLLHRRPTVVEAARAVDRKCGAKDLFLTTVLLENAPGDFKPLVTRDAEARAPKIKPVEVVPFSWQRQFGYGLLSLCLLAAGIRFLPQFDPFGKVEAAEKVSELEKQLDVSQKATQERIAAVRREAEEGQQEKEVEQAMEELKQIFNRMQPLAKKENFNALGQSQKLLGEKWMKLSSQKLKDVLSQSSSSQQFGGSNQEQLQKWTKELHEGSTGSLSKEIEQLKADLQKLQKMTDPIQKEQEAQKIRKRVQDLADFASENVKSKPLSAAIQRALEQMSLGKTDALSEKALSSMKDSLELAGLELKELAQSIQDLQKLEKSLKCTQMAKALNESEKLDGEACKGCKSMSDYEALFAKMLAEQGGEEEGEGLGGEGIGRGGKAPEDDSLETGFKSEHSKSAVTAGKVLLTLKSKGIADPAEVEKKHRELIQRVKQGVSEAVLQEQIPPGYIEGIKSYFDSIDSAAEKGEGAGEKEE